MSDSSLHRLYTLIEHVLFSEKPSSEDIAKALVDINNIALQLSSQCLLNMYDKVYRDICTRVSTLMKESIDTVLKYLAVRFFEGGIGVGKGTFLKIYDVFAKVIDTIRSVMVSGMVIQEEKVLCKVLKTFSTNNGVAGQGYLIVLPIDQAAVLAALGYVEFIRVTIDIGVPYGEAHSNSGS